MQAMSGESCSKVALDEHLTTCNMQRVTALLRLLYQVKVSYVCLVCTTQSTAWLFKGHPFGDGRLCVKASVSAYLL